MYIYPGWGGGRGVRDSGNSWNCSFYADINKLEDLGAAIGLQNLKIKSEADK